MLKAALRIVFALFFVGAGVNHFIRTGFYLRMMPPYVPLHLLMVQISGREKAAYEGRLILAAGADGKTIPAKLILAPATDGLEGVLP